MILYWFTYDLLYKKCVQGRRSSAVQNHDFYMETEGGSLIPHYVCLNSFTYTDITETVIYVGAMHALDKHGKVKRHLDSCHVCMTGY